MVERLEAEPNIPAASTFKTLDDAEALVSKSLASRSQEISKFLKGTKDKHIIREQSSQPVGLSVIRGTTDSIPVYKFLLILIRKPKMPDGYLLLTGYPIEK
nr:RNase A-like domain-containing protein [Pseudomonas sp. 31 R 17]